MTGERRVSTRRFVAVTVGCVVEQGLTGSVRSKAADVENLKKLCAYSYRYKSVGRSADWRNAAFMGVSRGLDTFELRKFRAQSGELNHWTITLPPKLVEDVRANLSKTEGKADLKAKM